MIDRDAATLPPPASLESAVASTLEPYVRRLEEVARNLDTLVDERRLMLTRLTTAEERLGKLEALFAEADTLPPGE